MRGARLAGGVHVLIGGIIPAYAGSTRRIKCDVTTCQDHPRVCGEHSPSTVRASSGSGSSPRMRGARESQAQSWPPPGIIPAYAGSTDHSQRAPAGRQDHPRVCGEHAARGARHEMTVGSSPRMRGALGVTFRGHRDSGIIPAYAGSTSSRPRPAHAPRDHPRVCGEHLSSSSSFCAYRGSSPRMRGAH